MSEELIKLKKRKQELLKSIEFTKQKKKEIIKITQILVSQFSSGRITKQEYEEKLKKALKNRTAEQWLKYYDDYIQYYKYQIKLCEKLIKQEKSKQKKEKIKEKISYVKTRAVPLLSVLIIAVIIAIFISLFFILKPAWGDIKEKISLIDVDVIEKPEIILQERIRILDESFTQYQAVIGKPVKWKLEFEINTFSSFKTTLPENSKIISVKDENEQDVSFKAEEKWIGKQISLEAKQESTKFKIIYETPGPEIKEEIISKGGRTITGKAIQEEITNKGKRIIITGPDDVHYKNILSFIELPEELTEQELEKYGLYQVKNGQRLETEFTAYDTDENGLYDFIEWITPYLSGAVYEWRIEISKAEHLNEDRESFIPVKDIYDEVKELDNIWSEEIPDRHYVRVTFEQLLDSSKDITIYPRVVSGEPRIEVYEIDSNDKIAEFEDLVDNEYNKVFLTNLVGQQDVFDLRVVGGSVEIDYIVDPTVFGNTNIGGEFSIISDFSSSLNHIAGGVYTAPADGLIVSISVYFDWFQGDAECAIYDENRDFIASTNIYDGNTGWETFDFASPVSVEGGKDYGLVCWGETFGGIYVVSQGGAPQTNYYQQRGYDDEGGAWPASLNAPTSTDEISIYASYGGCDPENQVCTDGGCDPIFKDSTSGWFYYSFPGDEACASSAEPYTYAILPDFTGGCDLNLGIDRPSDCAFYYDDSIEEEYWCPSYERKGSTVTASDCNCEDLGGGCASPDYVGTFDFSNEFFAGAITDCWDAGPAIHPICTCNDLQNISFDSTTLGWDYTLQNDVNCSETTGWNGGLGFDPIGTFTGTFDGQGFEISGLYINRSTEDNVGLFGRTGANAEIKNVGLVDINITGQQDVGGLVGYNNGNITNSFSTGNVNGRIVGGTYYRVGGLVGRNEGEISNSYFTGNVSADTNVGGLVGYSTGLVSNSYSTGNVSAIDRGGGLIGDNRGGIIDNSYSRASVEGSGSIGGLVGTHRDDGVIRNSYSTGHVSGIMGFVGWSLAGGICIDCFWDTWTSGQDFDDCPSGSTGKTTAEMKDVATFTDATNTVGLDTPWDFINDPYEDLGSEDIWDIDGVTNDGYPFLFFAGAVEEPKAVNLDVLYPTDFTGMNVTQNQFFNITLNVSCVLGNCGQVNVSLDPPCTDVDATRYCSVLGNTGDGEWITRVQFNGIDHSSGDDGGYADYTSDISDPLTPGQDYTIYISQSDSYNECFSVWFDWNQNQDFTDDLEYQIGCADNGGTVSNDISVPMDAVAGSTMFRVMGEYNEYPPGPCTNPTWNEIEDYTACVASPGKGLIPVDVGEPFYTNVSNPYNVTLNQGDSALITFWVNATGEADTTHEFFAYADILSHSGIENTTESWNVKIEVDPTKVTRCRNLTQANTIYTQTKDITLGRDSDCIVITAQNITLDCQGYYINIDEPYSGVYSNQFNTTIKNCNVSMGEGFGGHGIKLEYSDNSYILNNTLNDQSLGLYLALTNNVKIEYNIVYNNLYGIALSSSSNNILKGSTASSNDHGIALVLSSNNTLINNTANSNSFNGIFIYSNSNNNILTNITANLNNIGISLSSSDNNTLTNITASSNNLNGIRLLQSSNNILENINMWNCTTNLSTGSCLYFERADGNLISGGIINLSERDLIYLKGSIDNKFKDMELKNSKGEDVYLEYSSEYCEDIGDGLSECSELNTSQACGLEVFSNFCDWDEEEQCIEIGQFSGGCRDIGGEGICNDDTSGKCKWVVVPRHSSNNTFLNVSYDISKEHVGFGGSEIIRKWYYQAYVNNTEGDAFEGANVIAYNRTGHEMQRYEIDKFILRLVTNESGSTPVESLIDYINLGGTRNYHSNYTIWAYNATQKKIGKIFFNASLENAVDFDSVITVVDDNTAPLISNMNLSDVFQETANITWDTDEFSNSSVVYWNESVGQNGSSDLVINHSIILTGLFEDTTYQYNVTSCDLVGNCNTSVPYEYITPPEEVVLSCRELNQSNTRYYMDSSITNNPFGGDCIEIIAENITLDCQGNYIKLEDNAAGIFSNQVDTTIMNCNVSMGGGGGYGIKLENSDNSHIFNNTLNEQYYGLYLRYTQNTKIENNTMNLNSPYGIYFYDSINNIVKNTSLIDNNDYDFYISASSPIYCNNKFENVTGSGGREIGYYNYSVSEEVSDREFSELILCNADNSNLNNIIVSGSDTNENNGLVAFLTDNSNFSNINSSNNYNGIYFSQSSNNSLTDITADSNSLNGVYLYKSTDNNLINVKTENNDKGIYLSSSSNNNLINIITYGNGVRGIFLLQSSNNNLINITINDNSQHGIYLYKSSNNSLKNMIAISDANYGVYLYDSSSNNIIDGNFSGSLKDIYLTSNSINNSFLNVSYDSGNGSVSSNSELIRKWYYQANVTYGGEAVNGININVYNNLNNWQFNLISKTNGLTNVTGIIDYVNLGGTRNYYSNYKIYSSNRSLFDNHELNVTAKFLEGGFTGLIFDNIVLGTNDTIPPNINFVWPTPPPNDIRTENFIPINVTASDVDLGDNNISVFIDFNNSLVGWWRMDDVDASNDPTDYLGVNNGTAVGNAVQTDVGYLGKAFEFDGSGDYISLPAGAINLGDNSISISAWIRKNGNDGLFSEIFRAYKLNLSNVSVGFYISSDNKAVFFLRDVESDSITATSSDTIMAGSGWHHLVGSYDISTHMAKIYINNIEKGSDTNIDLGTLDTTGYQHIGSWVSPTDPDVHASYFNGLIDDVMIFNRALSPEEIAGLYANTSEKHLSQDFTDLAYGNYTFKAYAQDAAGNVNWIGEREVELEAAVAPEICYINSQPSPFTLTADDGTGTMDTSINAISFVVYDGNGVGNLPSNPISIGDISGYVLNSPNTPYEYEDEAYTKRFFNGSNCAVYGDFIDDGACGHEGEQVRRYGCSVDMMYYDSPSPDKWDVYITDFKDNSGDSIGSEFSDTDVFELNPLTGITISIPSIDFGVVQPDMTEGVSSTENMIIKNTGNDVIDGLTNSTTLYFKGKDLKNENTNDYISAENFIVHLDASTPCNDASDFITLADKVDDDLDGVAFFNIIIESGNHLINTRPSDDPEFDAQKTIYFCMKSVDAGLPKGQYSTSFYISNEPWEINIGPISILLSIIKLIRFNLEISILLVAVIVKKKRKKKIKIPLKIFSLEISPAEALCKYLREKGLSVSEITKLINRDKSTISINYKNALESHKEKIKSSGELFIDISIFSDRRLSILENVIKYLREEGYRNIEIARLINRDERIISNLYSRAKKKLKKKLIKVKPVSIPINIFEQDIGPAGLLYKYLRENLGLRFSDIAKLVNRNESTIWMNYHNAIKKEKEKIKVEKRLFVSINVFSNRKLSILEALVNYLKKKGFRNYEIAEMLNKDQRNIYTLHNRAKKKLSLF